MELWTLNTVKNCILCIIFICSVGQHDWTYVPLFYLLWIAIDTFWKTTLSLKSLYCSKKAVKCHSFEYLTIWGVSSTYFRFPLRSQRITAILLHQVQIPLVLFKKCVFFQISLAKFSNFSKCHSCNQKLFLNF